MKENRLVEAERDFRQVRAANPEVGGAYANLVVVYMRRKQWSKALEALSQAEHLMPEVAGIRLNIGLAYFRQNEFLKAILSFESVVREPAGCATAAPPAGPLLFFRGALGRRGEYARATMGARVEHIKLPICAFDRSPPRRAKGMGRKSHDAAGKDWRRFA
ncbi:MAG: tetratricopeptide repeat protein [Candidatus Sulfotelmatobacter sp.]